MAREGPAVLSEEYTWKSAGQTPKVVRDNIFLGQPSESTSPANPIGIKLPLQLGSERSGIFEMHFDAAEAISTNLRNLVMTNHGERIGNFLYGSNLGRIWVSLNRSACTLSSLERHFLTLYFSIYIININ